MLEDDTHYGEKILRAFENCCTGRGRPASIEASVFLLTSENAGHYIGYLTYQWGNILNRRSNYLSHVYDLSFSYISAIFLPFFFFSSPG